MLTSKAVRPNTSMDHIYWERFLAGLFLRPPTRNWRALGSAFYHPDARNPGTPVWMEALRLDAQQDPFKRELRMGAVDIFWYGVWLEKGNPYKYLAAYHHLADTLIYRDPQKQKDRFISKLRSCINPTSLLEAYRLTMAARGELKEMGITLRWVWIRQGLESHLQPNHT